MAGGRFRVGLALSALMWGLGSAARASSGTFGFGVELKGTGSNATNNGMSTLYALDNGGGTSLVPTSSTASLDTDAAGKTEAAPFFIGTFNLNNGDTLSLAGGSVLTYKNGSSDVTAAAAYYQILLQGTSSTSFAPINLPFNANLSGTSGDQRWASEQAAVNVLSGLVSGTYTIGFYGQAATSEGTAYEGNGGNNYGLSFTVVAPEPVSAVLFPLAGLAMITRRRSLTQA